MSAVDPARRVRFVPLGGFLGVAAGAGVGALLGVQLAWTDPDVVEGWLGFGLLGLVAGGVRCAGGRTPGAWSSPR